MPASRPRNLLIATALLVLAGVVVVIGVNSIPPAISGVEPTPTAVAGVPGTPGGDGLFTPTPTDSYAPTGPTPVPSESPSINKRPPAHSVEPEQLTGYVWPVRNARVSSRFAPRLATDGGFVVIDGVAYHDGLDLATFCGDEVRAAHDGTVLYAGRNFDPYLGYWGDPAPIYDRLERQGRVNTLPIMVVVDDGNGYRSIYVHLNEANVEAGALVMAGDVIGVEGATGFVTGCHLHYGMIRMDSGWQGVVPRLWQYGYPPFVRERVDPLKVLDWTDQYAPQRLRDKVLGTPSPLPSLYPAPSPAASVGPTDTPTQAATPSAMPSGSPALVSP
jgi:murein DD-endopeptidase MepM/ murein hydrolase activator NlpD